MRSASTDYAIEGQEHCGFAANLGPKDRQHEFSDRFNRVGVITVIRKTQIDLAGRLEIVRMFKSVAYVFTFIFTCVPVLAQSTTETIRAYVRDNLPDLGIVGDANAKEIQSPPRYYFTMPGYDSTKLPAGAPDEDNQ
jgi:hypothetical protein